MLFHRLVSLIDASLRHLSISGANYGTLDAHDHQKGTRYCLFLHSRPRIKQHVLRWSYETRDQKPDHVLPMSAIKIFVLRGSTIRLRSLRAMEIFMYTRFLLRQLFKNLRIRRNRSTRVSNVLVHFGLSFALIETDRSAFRRN